MNRRAVVALMAILSGCSEHSSSVTTPPKPSLSGIIPPDKYESGDFRANPSKFVQSSMRDQYDTNRSYPDWTGKVP